MVIKRILALLCLIAAMFVNNLYASEKMNISAPNYEEAIFAMGCFWCGESEFRDHNDPKQMLKGIHSVTVGYAGGTKLNPSYESHEGYKEAVKITYDPALISYDELLEIFWHNIDPFDSKGQFCDKGFPYTSVIFYKGDEQKSKATSSKEAVQNRLSKGGIITEIIPYTTFYDAEEYHQNYKLKNPIKYKYYRWNCGRDERLRELWKGKINKNG